jgi:hypothetical protein
MGTRYPNQAFYVWLVELQIICAKFWLETWFPPNNDIGICFFDIKHSWTKNAFETWITRNDVNYVSLIHVSNLKTLMAYLCSQWKPNNQIKYFMFERSSYRQFVLNRGRKRDSLQIIIFVYVSSTRSIVQIKKFLCRE